MLSLLHSPTLTSIYDHWFVCIGFLAGSVVKNPLAMQETQERQVQEDPLQEGRATHSSILAWRIPWTEEPGGGLQSKGCRVGHN